MWCLLNDKNPEVLIMSAVSRDFGGFCVVCAVIAVSSIAAISLAVLVWAQVL